MSKQSLCYPLRVWAIAGLVVVLAWLPYFDMIWMMAAIMIAALVLPAVRNNYVHPLGKAKQNFPYYHWLKSVPYAPGKKLPNGDAMPNWQDAVILAVLGVSMYGCIRNSVENMNAFVPALAIEASLLMFAVITAAQLLNVGPRWLGYLLLACVQVVFFANLKVLSGGSFHYYYVIGAGVIVIVGLAIWGLRRILAGYPWRHLPIQTRGVIRYVPLSQLLYGNVDVELTGEPFTSLRPRPAYRKVSWQEVVGITANVVILTSLFPGGWWSLAIAGAIGLVFRFKAYWSSREVPFGFPRPILRLIRPSLPVCSNTGSGFLLLFLIYVCACYGLYHVSYPVNQWLAPAAVAAYCVALFKMPPSRAKWETTGLWQITDSPPTKSTQGKHQSLKLSLPVD